MADTSEIMSGLIDGSRKAVAGKYGDAHDHAVIILVDRVAELRELLGEARSMVALAAAVGIKPGITKWLTKIDDARKVLP